MDKRSTTDLFTNQTIFSSSELLARLPELIDPHSSPPSSLLPTFLHEATHHWCFTSTVGTAIAILGMRGRVSALRALEAESPQEMKFWEDHAADDVTRAEIASLLLRPLAEGIATFLEFDFAISQHSPVVPAPARWAAMFCARNQVTGSAKTRIRRRMNIAHLTWAELSTARQSERMQRKKEALLAEPLSCELSDGYLVGYLIIKAIWEYWWSHHCRFGEPEVFLLKIYDIFYEDIEFVRLLLDQSTSIPASLAPLEQHLAKRLEYAFGASKDSLHDFFESLKSQQSRTHKDRKSKGGVLPLSDLVDNDPSARFRSIWNVVMGGPITDLPSNPTDWSHWQYAAQASHMIGHGRELLDLGALPVQLSAEKTKTVVEVEGRAVAHLRTFTGATLGRTSGEVHVLLNIRSGQNVVAAFSPKLQLVALQTTPKKNKAGEVLAARSAIARVRGAASFHAFMLEKKSALSGLREFSRLPGYFRQTRERLNGLYVPTALRYVPTSVLPELVPKMLTDGVYGAFDFETDPVRALAVIGSTAHHYWRPEGLRRRFEEEGLDYDLVMARLRECSRSTNLFRLREELGWVQSSL